MSKFILEFVQKKAWLAVILIPLLLVLFLYLSSAYPVELSLQTCRQTDTSYVLQKTTYRVVTDLKKEGGKVCLSIRETLKEVHSNLVELPKQTN